MIQNHVDKAQSSTEVACDICSQQNEIDILKKVDQHEPKLHSDSQIMQDINFDIENANPQKIKQFVNLFQQLTFTALVYRTPKKIKKQPSKFLCKKKRNFAKRIRTMKLKYCFDYGVCLLPHPDKLEKGGEDAYYVSDNVIAIADGVGSWSDRGIDPGLYSRELCSLIKLLSQKFPQKYIRNPKKLVLDAVLLNDEKGTCTVTVWTIDPTTGSVYIYYIGDSVYAIFNEKYGVLAPEQQKSFNYPYQVGCGHRGKKGIAYNYDYDQIKNLDIVIASDGLWDNVDLDTILQQGLQPFQSCQQKAQEITFLASDFSLTKNYESPFYLKAMKHGKTVKKAGKPDDITVVVANVVLNAQQIFRFCRIFERYKLPKNLCFNESNHLQ